MPYIIVAKWLDYPINQKKEIKEEIDRKTFYIFKVIG